MAGENGQNKPRPPFRLDVTVEGERVLLTLSAALQPHIAAQLGQMLMGAAGKAAQNRTIVQAKAMPKIVGAG